MECGEGVPVDGGERSVKGGETIDMERKQDQRSRTREEQRTGSGLVVDNSTTPNYAQSAAAIERRVTWRAGPGAEQSGKERPDVCFVC